MRLQTGDMLIAHYALYGTVVYVYLKQGGWGHEFMNMTDMKTYKFETHEIMAFFKNWEEYKCK